MDNLEKIKELEREIGELKEAIKKHRKEVRAKPCWEHDVELWQILKDGDYEWPLVSENIFDRMHGCLYYLKTHEDKRRK